MRTLRLDLPGVRVTYSMHTSTGDGGSLPELPLSKPDALPKDNGHCTPQATFFVVETKVLETMSQAPQFREAYQPANFLNSFYLCFHTTAT